MNGAELRLGRLFNRESGRTFIVAIDHGLAIGVPPGAEDAVGTVDSIISYNPDGIFVSPGLLSRAGHLFAFRGAPEPILRIDFLLLDERLKYLGEQHRMLCSPQDAVNLGAEAVAMFLVFGVERGEMFADNARAVTLAAREAHRAGLPLIVETVPWGSRINDRRDPDLLAFGCRMAAELGADAIKTEYTGDPETMASVVEGCPAPVLVLGGPKIDSENDLIESARGAMTAGAKGVIYGRNIWQATDPSKTSEAVRDVVHNKSAVR